MIIVHVEFLSSLHSKKKREDEKHRDTARDIHPGASKNNLLLLLGDCVPASSHPLTASTVIRPQTYDTVTVISCFTFVIVATGTFPFFFSRYTVITASGHTSAQFTHPVQLSLINTA
jgi:hypothetical protein